MNYQYSDDFFRAIVQSSADPITIFDKSRLFTYASPSAERLLGYAREELHGRPVFDFLHPGDVPRMEDALANLSGTPEVRLAARLLGKRGEWRPVEVTLSGRLADPAIGGVLCVLRERDGYQEDQAYFRSQVDQTPCALCTIDLNGVVERTNDCIEKIFRMSGDRIIGRRIGEIFMGDCQLDSAVENLHARKASAFESRICREGGEVAGVSVRVSPVCMDDQVIGGHVIIEDISGGTSDLDQLEMLSLVASKTTNGVIITDAADRVEWVNAAFTRVTGYPLSRIRGAVPATFLQGPETSPATALRIENNRKAKVSFTEEIQYHTITGDPIWFRMEVTPLLDQEGNLVRTITIQTDITEKKRTEQEMYKLTQNLSRQNQDLQQFTYMVSHNLRSPIANCKGLLELLSGIDKTDPFFDDSLQMLHSSVEHLEKITADMNSILTFRDQNIQSEPESVNLRSFLKDTVKDFQDFRSCSLTQINNKVPADLFVKGNRGFLHNIFTNLISNSIKYRSDERKLQVDLDAWYADGLVYITLADNGLGFDSDKLKNQLFKLYKRFHTDREEGRGIGLYLVKTAVETMNGRIDVESTPGVGTKFMISIPAGNQISSL